MNVFHKKTLFILLFSNFIFSQSYIKHQVIKGQTVAQIAKKYDVSESDLLKLNPEASKGISTNTVLFIPNTKTHIVQPKETIYGLANLYNVKIEDLKNANPTIELNGMKIGQNIKIPNPSFGKSAAYNAKTENTASGTVHVVAQKETLFGIAKLYGVSVEELDTMNADLLENGLRVGDKIKIPNKKSTVAPKTTSPIVTNKQKEISKTAALEKQKIENEVVIKEKEAKIEELEDKLTVQKTMNAKVLKVNALSINLKDIDEKKGASVDKLKLVLQANKDVQELLLGKLDSLVYTMKEDVDKLKNTELSDAENAKLLESQSAENIAQTNDMLLQLKRDLADTRKNYSLLINKIQLINQEEKMLYKKKGRELDEKNTDDTTLNEINKIKSEQESNDKKGAKLLTKIDALSNERNVELKKRLKLANFYSVEARTYDDKMAEEKLKRYRRNAESKQKIVLTKENKAISKMPKNTVNIEVLKNLNEVKKGYYLVLNIVKDAKERDAYVMKLIDSGDINASFFYNFNTFSYYIYSDYFKSVGEALSAFKQKENTKYQEKMFIVNIKAEDQE
jgi:LysM repeat protein